MIPSILIIAPTSERKDYCFERYAKQVRSFTYPDYDVMLCDNSHNPDYYHKIVEAGIPCVHIKPEGKAVEFIAKSWNLLREYFLRGRWDFCLLLETDNFVPENTLEYMVMFRHQVHNISYYYGDDSKLCLQAVPTNHKNTRTFATNANVGFHVYNGDIKQMRDFNLGEGIKLMASGTGCTMVHHSVMEKIKFRCDPNSNSTFPDSFFHFDIMMAGIENYLDTTIIAEHDRTSWKENPDVFGVN